ncbi:hypothetical protein [Streptomyces sp. NBC_01353]|uniref:hypothetical protein n=1 Tax=Streptomyces sp. NBC_01353 TaxID=2903835 RepID=UPI002E37DAEB|nr:hypothetical protein [Streptomyces sp. NBC_01353]
MTDTLRNRIARAIHQYDNQHALAGNDMPSKHHYGEADAVLALLSDFGPHWKAASQATHAAPTAGSGLTGCCRRTPFELPHTDLMTTDPKLVTCGAADGPAMTAEPDDEASLIPPSERRAQLLGELSVPIENQLRAQGYTEAADEIVGILTGIASQDERQTAPTPRCGHCKGSGADPEDEGDYLPEVGCHNPYSGGPCPQCNGTGTPAAELLGAGESRYTVDTITPEALHQLQVDRDSAIHERDMYKHRAERWHTRATQLRALTELAEDPAPAPDRDPEPRVPLAEHTDATLAELYDRLEDAEADAADARDAGRAIYRSWNEHRTALAEGATLAAGVHNTLLVLRSRMKTNSRDWAATEDDAWLYAVLMGWDCEQQHDHTDDCARLLQEVAAKHGWSEDRVARIRKFRAALAKAGPNGETDAASARAAADETTEEF